jgi:hypothetical protein
MRVNRFSFPWLRVLSNPNCCGLVGIAGLLRKQCSVVWAGLLLWNRHSFIYQYGLATLVVGLSSKGSPIGYRLMLLPTVPADIEEADEARVRRKIAGIVEPIATQLRTEIDSLPGLEEPGATATKPGEDMRQRFEDYATQTDNRAHELFSNAAREFNRRFRTHNLAIMPR